MQHPRTIQSSQWVAIFATVVLAVLVGSAARSAAVAPPPSTYVIDILAGADIGVDINDAGDAVGVRYIDVGCGFSCLAPKQEVVWSGAGLTALPWLPTWNAVYLEGISGSGWVVGTAYSGTTSRAVVWKPGAAGYEIVDLGTVPGTESSRGNAIDDFNRVIGYSSTLFPPLGVPFVWTEAEGFVDLTTLGFPSNEPRAMSPGGTIAYLGGWYQLDAPGVVHANTPPPSGFRGPGWFAEINDSGDQVRFLQPTSGQNLNYLFRYFNQGQWQQLSPTPGSDLSPFGVGSITAAGDITATISANGYLAPGPSGLAENLTARLSPAYGDAYVTEAGPINEAGEILAQVMIGRSPRLVRLVAPEVCVTGCTQVSSLRLTASGPNRCSSGSTRASVTVLVTDENGVPLRGVLVKGRFFDDYALDEMVQGTTSGKGSVQFSHKGPPCVGAIAFVVTDAAKSGRTFDRLRGTLQSWVIPN